MFGFWKPAPEEKQETTENPETPKEAPLKESKESTEPVIATPSASNVQPAVSPATDTPAAEASPVVSENGAKVPFPRPSVSMDANISEIQTVPKAGVDITGAALLSTPDSEPVRRRRISFRSFGFFYGKSRAPPLTTDSADTDAEEVKDSPPKAKIKSKREARKIDKAAFVLRSFLIGSSPVPTPSPLANGAPTQAPTKGNAASAQPKPPSPGKLTKANNQLLEPERANKVIARLRTLPVPNGPEIPGVQYAGEHVVSHTEGPIHAVCLDCTEEEADMYHFSRLVAGQEDALPKEPPEGNATSYGDAPSIASANLASLVPVLRDIHVVTLVSSPDLGLGQPPSDPGPLAGSVPSAQAVSTGMMEVTGQLLALGFATSKAVFPDHTGVYPPKDRMSVLTYWWGMEVCMPPPTIKYLGHVKSIQNAALNLLTAISLFNSGVREILPFIRYISQYLDFQWNAIKAQNKGKGVVCAATWVCPAALVPRPWDFPDPPNGQAVVIPKVQAPSNGPTIAFPGSKGGPFAPNAPSLPPVMITPATLPRGAKFEMLKT